MKKKINSKKLIFLNILLCIILILIFSYSVAASAHNKPPSSDDDHYVTMGYNLQKYGVLSLSKNDAEDPEPTAYREPIYPAYIALTIF
jgi:hypothetical protein